MTEPKPARRDKGEQVFAILLVLIAGLIVTCVVVITIGMMKFGVRKEIECRCPDGSIVKETASAMFKPEKVCPAICEQHRQPPPSSR